MAIPLPSESSFLSIPPPSSTPLVEETRKTTPSYPSSSKTIPSYPSSSQLTTSSAIQKVLNNLDQEGDDPHTLFRFSKKIGEGAYGTEEDIVLHLYKYSKLLYRPGFSSSA